MAGKCWENNWSKITPFFAFPDYIRKAIYTTNAIESLNMTLRKILKTRAAFPMKFSNKKAYTSVEFLKALGDRNYPTAIMDVSKLIADFWGKLDPRVALGKALVEEAGTVYETQDLLLRQARLIQLRRALEEQLARLQAKDPENAAEWDRILKALSDDSATLHANFLKALARLNLSRQQVGESALNQANSLSPRTASQVANAMVADGDLTALERIPGINPDAIAAIRRCNQIALTMVQRQRNLSAILAQCPKPQPPNNVTPPCPAYEQAAIQNSNINRSSMTCNKDSSGQYIPFFGQSKKAPGLTIQWPIQYRRLADFVVSEVSHDSWSIDITPGTPTVINNVPAGKILFRLRTNGTETEASVPAESSVTFTPPVGALLVTCTGATQSPGDTPCVWELYANRFSGPTRFTKLRTGPVGPCHGSVPVAPQQ